MRPSPGRRREAGGKRGVAASACRSRSGCLGASRLHDCEASRCSRFFYAVFWFAALGQMCLFILWEVS